SRPREWASAECVRSPGPKPGLASRLFFGARGDLSSARVPEPGWRLSAREKPASTDNPLRLAQTRSPHARKNRSQIRFGVDAPARLNFEQAESHSSRAF